METILLVEDARELSAVLQRELEIAGYRIIPAYNGLDALEYFNHQVPDLLILDWMLPGQDGIEVLRRIRKNSSIPVLMLTARSDPADRVLGLELGADDYLVKPFNLSELVARVRALFRRAERIHQMLVEDKSTHLRRIEWDCLTLDPEQHTCTLGSQSLDLTRIEFDLLHLLLRSPGRTFNRIYLLDTVWNVPYINGDRSVDNTVLRLRKKLGLLGDQIETVRGVGYRLRVMP
ncbi:MAG: response regulator transcription factor [Anaerolineaceae bacterium]